MLGQGSVFMRSCWGGKTTGAVWVMGFKFGKTKCVAMKPERIYTRCSQYLPPHHDITKLFLLFAYLYFLISPQWTLTAFKIPFRGARVTRHSVQPKVI